MPSDGIPADHTFRQAGGRAIDPIRIHRVARSRETLGVGAFPDSSTGTLRPHPPAIELGHLLVVVQLETSTGKTRVASQRGISGVIAEQAVATQTTKPYIAESLESLADAETVEAFARLKHEWLTGRPLIDSGIGVYMHPAYQAIIGMGPKVLPLVLRELQVRNDDWFWALRAITREDPCTDDIRGNLEAMKSAWLDWARRKNLRW